MIITDELREWWVRKFPVMDKELHKDFTAIADRIDAEHETTELQKESYRLDLKAANIAVGEAYKRGFDEGFASADDWLGQHEDAMAEHGWVRLPKDADGVPWRIGDRTESGQTIQAMGLNKHGWHFVGTVNEIDPSIHRHHHAQTVEDVLTEMLAKTIERGELTNGAAQTIAEYAKRLKLAEGEDA